MSKKNRRAKARQQHKDAIKIVKNMTEQVIKDETYTIEAEEPVMEMDTPEFAHMVVKEELVAAEEVVNGGTCDVPNKYSAAIEESVMQKPMSAIERYKLQKGLIKPETKVEAKVVTLMPVNEKEIVNVTAAYIEKQFENKEPQFINIGGVQTPAGVQNGILVYSSGKNTPIMVTNMIQPDGSFMVRRFHTFEAEDPALLACIDEADSRVEFGLYPCNFEYFNDNNRTKLINVKFTVPNDSISIVCEYLENRLKGHNRSIDGPFYSSVVQLELTEIVAQLMKTYDKYEDAAEILADVYTEAEATATEAKLVSTGISFEDILADIFNEKSYRNHKAITIFNKANRKYSVLLLKPFT